MSQSLVRNYIHVVFSTKNRQPLIKPIIENDMYAYLGGISKKLACIPVQIGGYRNHVHILCLLSKNIALAKYVEKIKSNSSKWIKTQGDEYKNFYWQRGYGAFSVKPSEIQIVIDYISNQEKHHGRKTFQEEYRAFLKKYKVEYDERYVWD